MKVYIKIKEFLKKFMWRKSKKVRQIERLEREKLQKFSRLEILRKKSVRELTAGDWEFLRKNGVVNGCGGNPRNGKLNFCEKIVMFLLKKILEKISPLFFTASCEKHDFGYWKGGNEARRKECDEKFLRAILGDIKEKFEHPSTGSGWQRKNSFLVSDENLHGFLGSHPTRVSSRTQSDTRTRGYGSNVSLASQARISAQSPLWKSVQWWARARGILLPKCFCVLLATKVHGFSARIRKMFYKFLAYAFYYAVRLGGKKFYNYY